MVYENWYTVISARGRKTSQPVQKNPAIYISKYQQNKEQFEQRLAREMYVV